MDTRYFEAFADAVEMLVEEMADAKQRDNEFRSQRLIDTAKQRLAMSLAATFEAMKQELQK